MKLRHLRLFLLVFFLLSVHSEAATNIKFSEYISIINKLQPDLKINNFSYEQSVQSAVQALGVGDTTVSANAERNKSLSSVATSSYSADYAENNVYSLGASKKILYTGTTISGNLSYLQTTLHGHSLADQKSVSGNTTTGPAVSVNVSQSLLKNSFGKNDRASLADSRLASKVQGIQTEINNQSVLSTYGILYFQWNGLIKTISFLSTSISNASLSEKIAKSQLSAGLIDNDDYQSIKTLFLQYQNSLLTYEQSLYDLQTKLQYYFDCRNINPDPEEWELFLSYALTNSFTNKAFSSTRSGELYSINKKRASVSFQSAANALLPDLSLYRSLTESENAESSSYPEYAVGLSLSYPLENRIARSTKKIKDLECQSQNLKYVQAEQNYNTQLNNILQEIISKRKIMKNTIERLKALRSMYVTQRVSHSQGRITQSTLNDTLIKIAAEEISLVDYQYNLISLEFNYASLVY